MKRGKASADLASENLASENLASEKFQWRVDKYLKVKCIEVKDDLNGQ